MKQLVYSILLLLVFACCGEEPVSTAPGEVPPPPAPKRAREQARERVAAEETEAATAAAEKALEQKKAEEMLAAHGKKREILVGGCAQRCRAPLDGFRGFARALWKVPDPDEVQPLLRFVDSAELVDGDTHHGTTWAQLFLDGRLAERREGIEAWRDAFVAEMGTINDPAELRAVLDAALDMNRISAEEVEIHFALPATDGGGEGDVWHFTFGRRGLEWLLRKVERP